MARSIAPVPISRVEFSSHLTGVKYGVPRIVGGAALVLGSLFGPDWIATGGISLCKETTNTTCAKP